MPDYKKKFLRLLVLAKDMLNIRKESDSSFTIENIYQGIEIKGPNLWYLICSALIASIGLDTNSPAVIIGAMLISPLMNPILGIGLSFGIHDKENLLRSIRQFSYAVIFSILISTLYFLITPFGNITEEIVARTKPTSLDILIAFFGGVAGIVAGSRKGVVSAIPGVAIATALMPPVCTAGFGIATANYKIFFGAFYLFFINSVFISLSAYVVVRLLKFPLKQYLDRKRLQRMRLVSAGIIFLVAIPSAYIFYGIIIEVRTNNRINSFINDNIKSENRSVVDWKLLHLANGNPELRIYCMGQKFSDSEKVTLKKKLTDYSIYDSELKLYVYDASGLAYQKSAIESDVMKNFELNRAGVLKKDDSIRVLNSLVQKNIDDSLKFISASNELKLLYPQLDLVTYSSPLTIDLSDNQNRKTELMYEFDLKWHVNPSGREIKKQREPIYSFLKSRLKLDTLILNFR